MGQEGKEAVLFQISAFQFNQVFYQNLFDKLNENYQLVGLYNQKGDRKTISKLDKDHSYPVESILSDKYKSSKKESEELIAKIENKLGISFYNAIHGDRHLARSFYIEEADYFDSRLAKSTFNREDFWDFAGRILKFGNELFDKYDPKFCILPSGNIVSSILVTLASYRGVRNFQVFFPRTIDMKEGLRYVTSNYLCENQRMLDNFARKEMSSPATAKSHEAIKTFLDNPRYFQPMDRSKIAQSLLRSLAGNIKQTLNGNLPTNSFFYTSILSRAIDTFKMIYKYPKQVKEHGNLELNQVDKKFVYLPFWQLPEIVNLEWSPEYLTTLPVVRNFRRFLKSQYELLIREHPYNLGRRPLDFYRKIDHILGTGRLQCMVTPFDILRKCSAVFTINGTTGWEGILFKKPVFKLERTFYEPLGLAKNLTRYLDLKDSFESHLEYIQGFEEKDYYNRIAHFMDSERESCFSSSKEDIASMVEYMESESAKELNYWDKLKL